MNDELAKRAVACSGWQRLPGLVVVGDVPLPEFGGAVRLRIVSAYEAWGGPVEAPLGWLPDFSDPATVGCLLMLVLMAHDQPELWETGAHPDGGRFITIGDRTWTGANIPFALVAALESTP